MHWSDVTQKSLRLCIRLQETGQQWSGGFALDTPGDLFVKIRHRYMPLPAGSAVLTPQGLLRDMASGYAVQFSISCCALTRVSCKHW